MLSLPFSLSLPFLFPSFYSEKCNIIKENLHGWIKFSLIVVRLMLSLVTAEVGQKYSSITSVSCSQIWVCVKESVSFLRWKKRKKRSQQIHILCIVGPEEICSVYKFSEHILQPTGRFKTYDSARWILLMVTAAFFLVLSHTHTHISWFIKLNPY